MYAIKSRGVGEPPSVRRVLPHWDLDDDEIKVDAFPEGVVMAEDERSLRAPTPEEITAKKQAAAAEKAREDRLRALPPTPDQLDALFDWAATVRGQHDAIASATTILQLRTAIAPITAPHPALDAVLNRRGPR